MGGTKRGASGGNRAVRWVLCQPIWAKGLPVVARAFSIFIAQPQFCSRKGLVLHSSIAQNPHWASTRMRASRPPNSTHSETRKGLNCHSLSSAMPTQHLHFSTAKIASTLSTQPPSLSLNKSSSIRKDRRHRTSFAHCRLLVPTCTAGTNSHGAE